MDELLSLKWNNHRSTFQKVLCDARNKQKYTDVTLACAGSFYNVHKIVLSSCSDYFKEIFDRIDTKNMVILLKDFKTEELEGILDYIYLGEVKVKQTELSSLIKIAECLQIKGLAVVDEEQEEKFSKPRRNFISRNHKRKRKLEDLNFETTPPEKMIASEISNTDANKQNYKIGQIITDSETIKDTAIKKEESPSLKTEIFSMEGDDYMFGDITSKSNMEAMSSDDLRVQSIPSTSETEKNWLMDDCIYSDDDLYHQDITYAETSRNMRPSFSKRNLRSKIGAVGSAPIISENLNCEPEEQEVVMDSNSHLLASDNASVFLPGRDTPKQDEMKALLTKQTLKLNRMEAYSGTDCFNMREIHLERKMLRNVQIKLQRLEKAAVRMRRHREKQKKIMAETSISINNPRCLPFLE